MKSDGKGLTDWPVWSPFKGRFVPSWPLWSFYSCPREKFIFTFYVLKSVMPILWMNYSKKRTRNWSNLVSGRPFRRKIRFCSTLAITSLLIRGCVYFDQGLNVGNILSAEELSAQRVIRQTNGKGRWFRSSTNGRRRNWGNRLQTKVKY